MNEIWEELSDKGLIGRKESGYIVFLITILFQINNLLSKCTPVNALTLLKTEWKTSMRME